MEKDMPFEEAMTQLEELVRNMEAGNLPLEDMIGQYENAKKLAAHCQNKLAVMKQKIEVLTKDNGADGEWRDMTPAEARPDQNEFFSGYQA